MSSAGHHIHTPQPRDGNLGRRRTCTVKRWRGYRTYTFYAELEGGGLIAESRSFRDRGRTADPSAAARERHGELVADLVALGWTLTDKTGPAWYEATLQRPLESWELPEAATPATAAPARPQPEPPARPVEPPVRTLARPLARLIPQEPVPAPHAPPEPAPVDVSVSARGSRRGWKKTAGAFAAVASAAGVAGIAIAATGPSRPQSTPARVSAPSHAAAPRHASPSTSSAPVQAAARPPAAKPVSAPKVHVTIAAPSRGSWLEVRRSSARGAVLFSGELTAGHRLRLKGTRLWARFGAAGNLSISVDGKPLVLQGTYEHVFRAHRLAR